MLKMDNNALTEDDLLEVSVPALAAVP